MPHHSRRVTPRANRAQFSRRDAGDAPRPPDDHPGRVAGTRERAGQGALLHSINHGLTGNTSPTLHPRAFRFTFSDLAFLFRFPRPGKRWRRGGTGRHASLQQPSPQPRGNGTARAPARPGPPLRPAEKPIQGQEAGRRRGVRAVRSGARRPQDRNAGHSAAAIPG